MQLRICPDLEALSRAAAQNFAARARAAIQTTGGFPVALAGGSTPRATYKLLAEDYRYSLDWSRIHIFFGDERCVPPDHPGSNYRMAYETLISHVAVGSIHRMRGELPPEEAAAAYETELRDFFGNTPRFSLILLGLGEDGHTASLFPHTSALDVQDRWVAANPVPQLRTTRLTLTLPAINAASAVMFLVSGASKASALSEVLEGDSNPHEYPAKLVRPAKGEVIWLTDRAAAPASPL